MSDFISDDVGAVGDSVRLQLGDDDIHIAESWDTQEGAMHQPGSWTLRIGHGGVVRELLERYPRRTPYKLFVGNALQMSGRIESRGASQGRGGASEVTFGGRDALAPLYRAYVRAHQSFPGVSSYADLVRFALTAAGLDATLLVVRGNAANRSIKTGIPIRELPHVTVEEILADKQVGGGTVIGEVHATIEAKLSETWAHFVRRHIERAGLFLWAGADGSFILAQPNGSQDALYRVLRQPGDPKGGGNIVATTFHDDDTNRHAEAVVYGRTGGKKYGRAKAKGGFDDEELQAAGYTDAIVFRDVEVHNQAEAVFFARRKLAEERRNGWQLEYTIAGHTLPVINQTGARAVVTFDTIVAVDDDEYGIHGNFYIESLRRQRAPETTTTIRLMRTTDLIFGGDDA